MNLQVIAGSKSSKAQLSITLNCVLFIILLNNE